MHISVADLAIFHHIDILQRAYYALSWETNSGQNLPKRYNSIAIYSSIQCNYVERSNKQKSQEMLQFFRTSLTHKSDQETWLKFNNYYNFLLYPVHRDSLFHQVPCQTLKTGSLGHVHALACLFQGKNHAKYLKNCRLLHLDTCMHCVGQFWQNPGDIDYNYATEQSLYNQNWPPQKEIKLFSSI